MYLPIFVKTTTSKMPLGECFAIIDISLVHKPSEIFFHMEKKSDMMDVTDEIKFIERCAKIIYSEGQAFAVETVKPSEYLDAIRFYRFINMLVLESTLREVNSYFQLQGLNRKTTLFRIKTE